MGPAPMGPLLSNLGMIRSSLFWLFNGFGRHRDRVLSLRLVPVHDRHAGLYPGRHLDRRACRLDLAVGPAGRFGRRDPVLCLIVDPFRPGLFHLLWAYYSPPFFVFMLFLSAHAAPSTPASMPSASAAQGIVPAVDFQGFAGNQRFSDDTAGSE